MARRTTTTPGDCRALLTQLFRYLDGELGRPECRAVEKHLTECRCCGPLAESLRRTITACRKAGVPEVPPSVRRTARARVKALLAAQKPK